MANQLKSHATLRVRFILSHLLPLESILSLLSHIALETCQTMEKEPEMRKSINFFLFQFLTFACCYCHCHLLSVNILEQQLNSFVSCRRLIAVWIRKNGGRFCVQFQLSIYKSIKGFCLSLLLYGLIKKSNKLLTQCPEKKRHWHDIDCVPFIYQRIWRK